MFHNLMKIHDYLEYHFKIEPSEIDTLLYLFCINFIFEKEHPY